MNQQVRADVQHRAVQGVIGRPVQDDGAAGIEIREVFTASNGAPTFAMRRFDVEPSGHTPFHTHKWEHEVYILEGEGALQTEGSSQSFRKGDALLVPAGVRHQFAASPRGRMQFLCMIPVQQNC